MVATIMLRSANGTRDAARAVQAGDYNGETDFHIQIHDPFFREATVKSYDNDLLHLMQRVGQVEGLVLFKLSPIQVYEPTLAKDCFVPVRALAGILEHADDLERLSIENVCLVGREKDFDRFAVSLKHHPALLSVNVRCGCRQTEADFATPIAVTTSPLDGAIRNLGTVPLLKEVRIMSGLYSGDLTSAAFIGLCKLPALKTLKLFTVVPSDDCLAEMAPHLGQHPKLTTLSIGSEPLTLARCETLKEIFSNENSKLQQVHLSIDSIDGASDDESESNDDEEEISEEEDEAMDADLLFHTIVNAVVGSPELRVLNIDAPTDYAPLVVKHTKTMLRSNYFIEEVHLRTFEPFEDGIVDKWEFIDLKDEEIAFLGRANKLGRGKLLQNEVQVNRRDLWRDLLWATKDKLDNIYALINSHPTEFTEICLEFHQRSEKSLPSRPPVTSVSSLDMSNTSVSDSEDERDENAGDRLPASSESTRAMEAIVKEMKWRNNLAWGLVLCVLCALVCLVMTRKVSITIH